MNREPPLLCHATAVAYCGVGALIIGQSGSGKSSLALDVLSKGADLIADDQVELTREGARVVLDCPTPLRGMIEARGIGILHTSFKRRIPLALVVDMDMTGSERLPADHQTQYLGVMFRLVHKVASPHFSFALLQYLKSESSDT